MTGQVCPFHSDEWIQGRFLDDEAGTTEYTCPLTKGHPGDAPFSWPEYREPQGMPSLVGRAKELNLDVTLPAAVASCGGGWVEFGLVERAYALANKKDFAKLVKDYGHTAIARDSQYSASAFLARALGTLGRAGVLGYRSAPGTGRWAYNNPISWWAPSPDVPWGSRRQSWEDAGFDMSYVPGATETTGP